MGTAEPPTNKRGGKRVGAGRKRSRFRLDAPHRKRATFDTMTPVHVVMRGEKWISGFRTARVYRVLCAVLLRYVGLSDFRVVHISIQDNHVHLIVEAANDRVLETRMRSFSINAARAIHGMFNTCGRVFFRYHSTVIRTKRYARNAIAYVLGNWRRHRQDFLNGRMLTAKLDQYSSAISFDGWNRRFKCPADHTPLPVSPPQTELMRSGWAIYGPLDPTDAPGPLS